MHGRRQRERHKSARFPSPRDETPCRSFAHSNGPLSVDARHLRQLCEKSHCVLQPGPLSINTKPFRTSSLNTNTGGTYITLQLHKHDLGLSPERVFFFFFNGLREQRCRLRDLPSSILLFTTELHQVDFLHWLSSLKKTKPFSLGVPVFDAVCGL